MNDTSVEYKGYKAIIIYSIGITIASQIKFSILTDNFVISSGVILMAVLLFLIDEFPMVPVIGGSALGIWVSRGVVYSYMYAEDLFVWKRAFPEVWFYLVYGFTLLYIHRYITKNAKGDRELYLLFFPDYIANNMEILLRSAQEIRELQVQLSLILIAIIRTVLIIVIIRFVHKYGFTVIRKDQLKRYHHLMHLMTQLQGEVIWMRKNLEQIENTMRESYELYDAVESEGIKPEWGTQALQVAMDVHEVKKEYRLILRGLEDALQIKKEDGMYFSEIMSLLQKSLVTQCEKEGRHLILTVDVPQGLYTAYPYHILSIFRNLLNNAMEAVNEKEIRICIWTSADTKDEVEIAVTNEGSAIKAEEFDSLFRPGYSTKFDKETGEINRGLGLPMVKDILEAHFGGEIRVESEEGKTTFFCKMNKKELRSLKM